MRRGRDLVGYEVKATSDTFLASDLLERECVAIIFRRLRRSRWPLRGRLRPIVVVLRLSSVSYHESVFRFLFYFFRIFPTIIKTILKSVFFLISLLLNVWS